MAELLEVNGGCRPVGRPFHFRVIGVGGGGCNVVAHLAEQPLDGVEFALMNTDSAAISQLSGGRRFVLGERSMRGLGAGGDPERGRAAAEEDAGAIRELCQKADVVFVVAGMGGGTGTGAAPVVARVAREVGALVVGIVVTPFDCEGRARQRRASHGLQQLRATADAVICLPNQKVLQMANENTSLVEAFRIANEFVGQGVKGVWRMLHRPGLINVDFADLCAVLRGRHADSSLASAEAQGENRASVVLERLLAHPLIDGGTGLSESSHMLVCLVGGADLSMRDVNHITEQLRRHAEHANIVLGTSIDDTFKDRIAVTVMSSRSASGAPAPQDDSDEPGVIVADESGRKAPAEDVHEPLLREENLGKSPKVSSRFVAPAPESTPEMVQRLASQSTPRGRRRQDIWKQGTLNLEIVSKGRFEQSEPTIHHGQDLDIPTFVRRGVTLN